VCEEYRDKPVRDRSGFRLRLIGMRLIGMCLIPLLLVSLPSYAKTAKVDRTHYDKNTGELVIHGSQFGGKCSNCEILANYGKFTYSLPILFWKPTKIVSQLPNFGVDSASLKLITKTNSQLLPGRVKIGRSIVPRRIEGLINRSDYPDLQSFEYISNNPMGDKGLHSYRISQAFPSCNNTGMVFHDAQLQIGKRSRFSKAKIHKKPKSGCKKCKPIEVQYYIEPTGFLHYQLHIYREKLDGICSNRLRKSS